MNSLKYKYNNNISLIKDDLVTNTIHKVNDINSHTTILIPHVCNNINIFGAGFARYIGEKFPIVKENFHLLGNKSVLGYTQFIPVLFNNKSKTQIIVCNMIAQNGIVGPKNTRPLNYGSLVLCMYSIKNQINNLKNQSIDTMNFEIHAPKFGSGLAGGNWLFIEQLIQDIWSNIQVFVYIK